MSVTTGIAGLASIVLVFGGQALVQVGGSEPAFDAPADRILRFLEARHVTLYATGSFVGLIAILALAWFLAGISAVLREVEGSRLRELVGRAGGLPVRRWVDLPRRAAVADLARLGGPGPGRRLPARPRLLDHVDLADPLHPVLALGHCRQHPTVPRPAGANACYSSWSSGRIQLKVRWTADCQLAYSLSRRAGSMFGIH
jgi:hypothetical protein